MANLEKMALENINSSLEPVSHDQGIEAGISPENIATIEAAAEVLVNSAPTAESSNVAVPLPAEIMPLEVEIPVPDSASQSLRAVVKGDAFGDWSGLKSRTDHGQISPHQAVSKLTEEKSRFVQNLENGFSGL